jgi:hypothetical protein
VPRAVIPSVRAARPAERLAPKATYLETPSDRAARPIGGEARYVVWPREARRWGSAPRWPGTAPGRSAVKRCRRGARVGRPERHPHRVAIEGCRVADPGKLGGLATRAHGVRGTR